VIVNRAEESTGILRLEEMSATEVSDYLFSKDMAMLPVGCVEVNGPHLPLGTDTFIVLAICQLIAVQTQAVILPPIWYTPADTTNELPATISVDWFSASEYVKGVCKGVVANGFHRLLVINVHGRSNLWLPQVVAEVFAETEVPVFYVDAATCLGPTLDQEVFGQAHNHYKVNALLLAALALLDRSDLVAATSFDTQEVDKPDSLTGLLSLGHVGYYYNRLEEHVAPRGDASIEQGMAYLKMVSERLVSSFEHLDEYTAHLASNPRRRKKRK
jgi:creatinine amidohydrolase/Fe(II)-dependent formamide hydrolase-like protein